MSSFDNEFTTSPVPPERRVAWWRVGLISAMVAFSLPTFITGIEVSQSLFSGEALLAILCGNLILTVIASVSGSIGSRTHLSSYMLVRSAFGDRGAAFVNVAFAVSLLGWFGVNIDLFSGAVERLLDESFGTTVPIWLIELGAGIVMTVTTVYGFRAINALSLVLVPVLMVVTALLLNAVADANSEARTYSFEQVPVELTFGDAVSSVVGGVIVGAVILPDITRFIRHWPGAIYTAFLSYLIVGTIVMGTGAVAAAALERDDLLEMMLMVGIGWGAFAIVIFGSWVLNSLNLYSAMLSVEATWPALNNRILVIVLGALGTGAAFMNILDAFLTFLFYLAIVFVPVAGVVAVDYLFTRRSAYHEEREARQESLRLTALGSWVAGAVIALLGAEEIIRLSGVAALDAMIVAALAYAIASRIVRAA